MTHYTGKKSQHEPLLFKNTHGKEATTGSDIYPVTNKHVFCVESKQICVGLQDDIFYPLQFVDILRFSCFHRTDVVAIGVGPEGSQVGHSRSEMRESTKVERILLIHGAVNRDDTVHPHLHKKGNISSFIFWLLLFFTFDNNYISIHENYDVSLICKKNEKESKEI